MKITRRHLALSMAATVAGVSAMPAQAQKVIKYAHFHPAKMDQSMHASAVTFKEHVEKATGGSIKVEIYPAGQLGSAQQVMEGLRLGTIEFGVVHEGGVSGVYRPFNIFGMPYMFQSHAHAYAVLDGPFGKELGDDLKKKTGIKLLGYADNGIRHFTNSKRVIRTPEDMKGLKIRVQPSPVFIELVKALGASPTAIDWGETPAALAQGTADGQENSVTTIMSASLYQHQKYATLDGHIYGFFGYLVNDRFYNTLTSSERTAVDEGAAKAKAVHRDMTRAMDLSAKKVLSDHGMQVTELTPSEIEQFRKLTQPAVRKYLETSISKEWTDKILNAVEVAKK